MADTTVIIGTCTEMCPSKERLMREREGLLHRFEWASNIGTNHIVSTSSGRRPQKDNRARKTNSRKGDVTKVVKSFARSAAGLDKTSPSDLRPAKVLEQTVEYLYSEILTLKGEAFTTIYDFIFDRLRSVRQDLVIQRVKNLTAIRILESIVRFHIFSAFRCRHEPVSAFDPHTNRKHLVDNLKSLLALYESYDYWEITRTEFESLYVIICPSSGEVLRRAVHFRHANIFQGDSNYKHATDMCLSYQSNNFAKYFKTLKLLPPLMCAASFDHVRKLRGNAFQIIAKAFRCSTCRYPIEKLQSVLLYSTLDKVEEDLRCLNVEIVEGSKDKPGKFAVFTKATTFTTSQLERLNCDLNPLSGDNSFNLFADQADNIASIIWPQHSTTNVSSLSAGEGRRDWFSDGEEEEGENQ